MRRTCSHKFRAPSDVNQWVCLWWQVASGQFVPGTTDNLVSSVTETTVDALCRCVEEQSHAMICVNDPEEDVDFEALSRKLRMAFQRILPNQSPYEKA